MSDDVRGYFHGEGRLSASKLARASALPKVNPMSLWDQTKPKQSLGYPQELWVRIGLPNVSPLEFWVGGRVIPM